MDSVSEALLAQLAKGTSSSGKGRDSVDVSKLPESIQKLVAALNKDAAARAKAAKADKDEKDAAQKRQNTIDGLQREFNTNLKELVDITEELNKTQGDALKQAEKRAKKQEERFKKEEAARKRAEKIAALQSKPKDIMSGLKADFFGAIFGKGVGDFMKNVSRAKEQTKADVSELAEARYADKIATAEEKKADAFSAAEAKREDTVEGAKAARKATLEKTTTEIGTAIQSAQENSNKQLGAEAAYAEWDKARKDRDSIAREGESRLSQAGKSAPTVGSSGGAGGAGGGAAAPAAPLIVSPTGDDALADAEVAKARREVAEANMAAEQAVSAAAEKLQAATGGGEVDKASIGYAGAVAGGEAAAAESRTSADATKEAIQDAILTESTEKANATYAAAQEKGMANAEMAKGNMVSAAEKSSIGKANMLSTAIAPPALVIIGKVMEKFQGMFPIVEQTGNSLIELATVIPATLFTITGQLTAKLLYALASIRDAISTPDVRERYDKSDAEVHEKSGKSRADLYAEAEERNLEAYKKNGTVVKTTQSTYDRAANGSASVKSNTPSAFTVENIPGTASGITHTAGTSYEAREQINAAAAARAAAAAAPVEKPMPVVSAGPSNSNVDQWRQ